MCILCVQYLFNGQPRLYGITSIYGRGFGPFAVQPRGYDAHFRAKKLSIQCLKTKAIFYPHDVKTVGGAKSSTKRLMEDFSPTHCLHHIIKFQFIY